MTSLSCIEFVCVVGVLDFSNIFLQNSRSMKESIAIGIVYWLL